MTDGQLIAAAHNGDADAWRTLYQRWLPWVWRYAYSLVQETHAAEDVTSEAMTAWVQRLAESGGDAPQLAAWLRTVVRNKAADHHRRASRGRQALQQAGAMAQQNHCDAAPSQPFEDRETRCQVNAALERLPESYRLALEWKYADSLSVQEIARRMGTTQKAVEAILYRARKEFRRAYELFQAQQEHVRAPSPVDPPRTEVAETPQTES